MQTKPEDDLASLQQPDQAGLDSSRSGWQMTTWSGRFPPMAVDRSHWVVRKCESFEEMEFLHVEDWQKCTGSDRANAAWEMVVEAWELKKRDPNELRFQRTARCLKRAGR